MESKVTLTLRGMRVLFFSILFFGSFTASLYLPHQDRRWRFAMILLMAFNSWGLVSSYRRRTVRRREQQL